MKFWCFMLGALLSVLSVVGITAVTTWIVIDREPIFKSEHKKPNDISGYNDSEVTNIISLKKKQASLFRSEETIDLDDKNQVDGLRTGVLVIDKGTNAYLKASDSLTGYTWLIDERSCKK